MPPVKLNAVVTDFVEINPELIILSISPEGWQAPDFKPGQYCTIGVPASTPRPASAEPEKKKINPDSMILRPYSIASSPLKKNVIELMIAVVPSGALTPRLTSLKKGDKLYLAPGIKGMFTTDELPKEVNVILMCTGTGLAPYMSMLRTDLLERGHPRIALLHGVRHTYDLGYKEELEDYREQHKNFSYLPVVSRSHQEEKPWSGHKGHVQDVWKKGEFEKLWGMLPQPSDTHFYLCGGPAMINDAIALLEKEGFKEHKRGVPGQIHVERYW